MAVLGVDLHVRRAGLQGTLGNVLVRPLSPTDFQITFQNNLANVNWPQLTVAVSQGSGSNLAATRTARLGLGHTLDVSMIDGDFEVLELDALAQEPAARFAARSGFDPRMEDTPYRWFRITPRRIHAWREANELPGRVLMRDGQWLD